MTFPYLPCTTRSITAHWLGCSRGPPHAAYIDMCNRRAFSKPSPQSIILFTKAPRTRSNTIETKPKWGLMMRAKVMWGSWPFYRYSRIALKDLHKQIRWVGSSMLSKCTCECHSHKYYEVMMIVRWLFDLGGALSANMWPWWASLEKAKIDGKCII